jgi:hypothetical protein
MARLRPALGFLAGAALFAALLFPSRWLELRAVRELLRGAEAAGLMDLSGGLGGQILGYNYYRKPEWVHWAVWVLSAAAAYAPALACSLLLAQRIGGGSAHTRCGRCDAVLKGLTEPRCSACGEAL